MLAGQCEPVILIDVFYMIYIGDQSCKHLATIKYTKLCSIFKYKVDSASKVITLKNRKEIIVSGYWIIQTPNKNPVQREQANG